ncbi:MAG: hypothetical protein JXA82_18985, partial [Sedimentisphaerales bacterium]|nr:hypothetical protein [Sedimentisphaerales bacterium]
QTCDATDSCGAYSISWSIVTGGELPPAPALLSPANGATVADLTPTFDWSDVADVSYYYLQVSDNAGFVGLQINTWTVGSAYTPTTALESGTYYWRVKTRDTMNTWGDWSETWSVTLEGEPPAANLIIDSLSSVFGGTSIMPIYGVTTGQMADRTGFIGVKATI